MRVEARGQPLELLLSSSLARSSLSRLAGQQAKHLHLSPQRCDYKHATTLGFLSGVLGTEFRSFHVPSWLPGWRGTCYVDHAICLPLPPKDGAQSVHHHI